MELDDLKKSWKQHIPQKINNTDIMEMIHHKSYGPIAALKKAYRKQMIQLGILPLLLLLIDIGAKNKTPPSPFFWTLVSLTTAAAVYYLYNYRIVTKMEGMAAMVKQNLEQQIHLLDTSMKRRIKVEKWLTLLFLVAVELIPYFTHMPDKWLSPNPIIRFGIYGLLLAYQYYVHTWMINKRYGQHISYLKNLVKEMQ